MLKSDFLDPLFRHYRRNFSIEYKVESKYIISFYDMLNELFWKYYCVKKLESNYCKSIEITSSIILKSFLALYSSWFLTKQGFIGSARILFRQIAEYLIVAKAIIVSNNDSTLANKWKKGDEIKLNNDIFCKLEHPNKIKTENFQDFWDALCKYTHGTIYAQQGEFEFENMKTDIKSNLVYIIMLLNMFYNLINSYYANRSTKYYINVNKLMSTEEKEAMFNIYKISQSFLNNESKKVIRTYNLRWRFKS